MKDYNYAVSDFIKEYQNILMVRLGASISESSRYILDIIEEIDIAIQDGKSAIEFFHEEDGLE